MQAARLVRWLTQRNPSDRPSAVEVLRSELLPPSVADEQLTDLLRSIPERHVSFLCDFVRQCLLCSGETSSGLSAREAIRMHIPCKQLHITSDYVMHGALQPRDS